jgi:hypothetical protein
VGILVVLLVAAWGLVLGPAVLQSLGTSPIDTERMFRKSLRALGRRPRQGVLGGRSILVPPKSPYPLQSGPLGPGLRPRSSGQTAAARRRRNLTYLAVFIIATFVLGMLPPLRFLLIVNLIADVMLVLYLALAMYMAVWPAAAERREVTDLDGAEPLPPQAIGT